MRKFIVAVPSASIDGIHYARKHVAGYTSWNVTVDMTSGELVSVRLRAENVDRPSRRAIDNYARLRRAGIL